MSLFHVNSSSNLQVTSDIGSFNTPTQQMGMVPATLTLDQDNLITFSATRSRMRGGSAEDIAIFNAAEVSSIFPGLV